MDEQKQTPAEQEELRKLEVQEQLKTNIESGNIYKPNTNPKLGLKSLLKRKKALGIGGGILAAMVAVVLIFMSLLPLKLEFLVKSLSAGMFNGAEHIIETRAEYLTERYIARQVVPGLQNCYNGRVRVSTRFCSATKYGGGGMVKQLFDRWRVGKFEQRLALNQGIEFFYDRSTNARGTLEIRTPAGTQSIQGIDGKAFSFDDLSNREMRRTIKEAVRKETRMWQVYKRLSMRRLLRHKYNVRKWSFFEGKRDEYEQKKFDAKKRLQRESIERVVAPISGKLAAYFSCITAVGGCSSAQADDLINQSHSDTDFNKISDDVDNVVDEGGDNDQMKNKLMVRIMEKLFGQTGAKIASRAAPVVGWVIAIDTLARIDASLEDGALTKFQADLKKTQYAAQFAQHANFTDQMKAGKLEMAEVNEMLTELNGVESSRLYQNEYLSGDNFAYAAEERLCLNGEPLPPDTQVCPELRIDNQNTLERHYQSFRGYGFGQALSLYNGSGPIRGSITRIIQGFDNAVGWILERASPLLKAVIPDNWQEWMEEKFTRFLFWMFGVNVTGLETGADKFDVMYAGADVIGNEYIKGGVGPDGESFGLGGKAGTPEEVAAFRKDVENSKHETHENMPFLTKVFSKDYEDSLINRMAVAMPSSTSGLVTYGVKSLRYLPRNIFASARNIFSPSIHANEHEDPFGITQYVYPASEMNINPDALTDERCAPDKIRERREASLEEDVNGLNQHMAVEPCLLEMATIEALGAMFEETTTAANSISDRTVIGNTDVTGTAQSLARQLLDKGSPYINSKRAQLQAVANGENIINRDILWVTFHLSEKYEFRITSLRRYGQGGSRHNSGNAVDISGRTGINGESFTWYGNSKDIVQEFINDGAKLLLRLGNDRCGIGVPPNGEYLRVTREKFPNCTVFNDKGGGPHIHFDTRK